MTVKILNSPFFNVLLVFRKFSHNAYVVGTWNFTPKSISSSREYLYLKEYNTNLSNTDHYYRLFLRVIYWKLLFNW
jgi:hypothetical protein